MAGEDNPVQESLGRQTRQLLKEMGLKAKKGLGQHFLVDSRALGKVVSAGRITAQDTVIEVGPGLGVLTRELSRQARHVICVEIDSNLSDELRSRLKSFSNVSIVNADILKTNPVELLPAGINRYKVVANLPYYITGVVLRHFLEAVPQPELMVVMLQKEVARAITAKPGQMSLLSVGVQLYGQAEIIASVPGRSFYPVPKVDSSVVRITARSEPVVPVESREEFFNIVRAGFCTPRKQLVNTLSHGLGVGKEQIIEKLNRVGIAYQRRAETLSVEEWRDLWQVFAPDGGTRVRKTGTG